MAKHLEKQTTTLDQYPRKWIRTGLAATATAASGIFIPTVWCHAQSVSTDTQAIIDAITTADTNLQSTLAIMAGSAACCFFAWIGFKIATKH